MQVLSTLCVALLAHLASGETVEEVQLVNPEQIYEVDATDGPILREILSPIDWVTLGEEALQKKREFLELPNLGLGCEEYRDAVYDTYYNFYKFEECAWIPVSSFPNYERIRGPSPDSSYPIINEWIKFPFFGELQLAPSVWTVSTNGYILVKPGPGANRSTPRLDQDKKPWKVISPLFTALTPKGPGTKILYGNFRMGPKVYCTKVEWYKFAPAGQQNRVDVQLDICSNGIFTARTRKAENLSGKSQIGLNFGGSDTEVFKFAALPRENAGYSYQSYSAVVMRPVGSGSRF